MDETDRPVRLGPYIGTGDLPSRAMLLVRRMKELEAHLGRAMTIIETGAIRIDSELAFEGDGHSTLLIARFVAASRYRHRFISIDIDQTVCDQVLTRERVRRHVVLVTGDSRKVLPRIIEPIDVAYFDSGDGSDPNLLLNEVLILLPRARSHALFCCDDAHEPTKSGALIEWIHAGNIEHEMEERLMFFWPEGRKV